MISIVTFDQLSAVLYQGCIYHLYLKYLRNQSDGVTFTEISCLAFRRQVLEPSTTASAASEVSLHCKVCVLALPGIILAPSNSVIDLQGKKQFV